MIIGGVVSGFKTHGYTVSYEAKQGLYTLFAEAIKPSRTTLWARRPTGSIDALGKPIFDSTYTSTHVEGLSHALIQLARNSDFDDWLPNPQVPMYLTTPGTVPLFYNPPDLEYLAEAAQDGTKWDDLPASHKQDRLNELQRKRGWTPDRVGRWNKTLNKLERTSGISNIWLSLPNDIRRYYHNLRLFFSIPLLPGCRSPHNLTTSVGVVLEAIGTKHLFPSAAYLNLIAEPNPRKASAIKARLHANGYYHTGQRKFGNHAHTPYVPKEWRALPHISQFTQADVDYCCTPENISHLHDLAEEACALNPALQLLQASTTPPVSGDTPDTSPTRAKPHIDLVPPTSKPSANTYHYTSKADGITRDVTKYILEAVTLHYGEARLTFPQLQGLADRAQLPLYMLQRLATREYVRRLDSEASNATP